MAFSFPSTWLSMGTKWVGRNSTVADGDWKQYTRPTRRQATIAARCTLRWSWCTSCTECV